MRILDRYIFKSVFSIFISCIFVFLLLYVTIDVLTRLEDLLKHQTPVMLLIQYYISYMPVMFVQVSPFACLLSTLYTFGRLNHENEIIAMRASGLSIPQIARTVIIMGAIVSLTVFWVSDRIIPRALTYNKKVLAMIDAGKDKTKIKKQEVLENVAMYGAKNRLFFINKYTPATNTMEGITILEHDENQNITRKIVANKGIYSGNLWKFYQSITYTFNKNGQIAQEPQYADEEIVPLTETPANLANQRQRPELMSIAELDDYIWRLSRSGASTVIRGLKIELYQRFTAPLTTFIIVMIGIPFALVMRRKSSGLASIGIAIMVGFLYYTVDAICIALGKHGILPPVLAAVLSHGVALIYALYRIETLP